MSIHLSLSDCFGPKKGTNNLVRAEKLLCLSIDICFAVMKNVCFRSFRHKKRIMFHHFYCKVGKTACIFVYSWAHRRIKTATAFCCFGQV